MTSPPLTDGTQNLKLLINKSVDFVIETLTQCLKIFPKYINYFVFTHFFHIVSGIEFEYIDTFQATVNDIKS